ncbi:MAG: CinA family nicotinamide mononucleotide deamidase-related protein [Planctomycetota bacterium]|jgi:nicotinamide-nucleotide amidase|nr:competence/damage-inducible protein A [Planctomycetota bacterium]MDP6520386.1 CinA family nicotinamide mononucleotide deamidase-related protein [Planctomycetota bacterium]MDP6837346.1 CinA family nicotinamide mononucleotide deamidase-related protein [Planctomycetota bacterium]MDP6956669.1 CinA family nicotinamide mononucleotide deamidase-related protein [Planctomycetota bacterium]
MDAGGAQAHRRAAVLAIGDELLAGAHADLNSPRISRELATVGWPVGRVVVVGDNEDQIVQALEALCRDHDVVLVTGGLGPTLDDVTRSAVARAARSPLLEHAAAAQQISAWFAARGREMPGSNLRQALFPKGAEVLPNALGTAPGFTMETTGETAGARLFVLPGPPREMAGMLLGEVLPRLAQCAGDGSGQAAARRDFFMVGLSESAFADAAGDWMERSARPRMGVTAKTSILSVRLTLEPGAGDHGLLEERAVAFQERFERWIFSEQTPDLARVVGEHLLAENTSLALAESCTGGLVAGALTGVPGISRVFREGLVTYSNRSKCERLGVDRELIERHGAVSPEVAAAMAEGCARSSGADIALAVTGIAGPGGGTPDKPVGLIWYGLHRAGETSTAQRRFPARGRQQVREFATQTALALIWRALRA